MHLSPDFVASVVFGVVMIIIGLAAIWIVHWQTKVLLRDQQRVRDDLERGKQCRTSVRMVTELSNLASATTLGDAPAEGVVISHNAKEVSGESEMVEVDEL